MSGILDYFADWSYPTTLNIQQRVTGYDPVTGKVSGQDNWVTVTGLSAVPVIFYKKSVALNFVDDKLKKIVSGLLVINPTDLAGVVVKSKMRGILDSIPYYFLDVEDVMGFSEVITIPVSEKETDA